MAHLLQSSRIHNECILMMTALVNRIGLVSMEYASASYLNGWWWWEACRNLLLVAFLSPVELLGLRLVSFLLPSQPRFLQRWGEGNSQSAAGP